jgi:4-amino-4-deoxy-L-arabinose transferase-like glycosyltransferase
VLTVEHREMVIGTPHDAPESYGRLVTLLEALGVLALPVALFFILRLQVMTPPVLPDPAIFTTFIVDPRDMFTRYAAVFASTSRMREASQVGFVVPARAFYLAFGAVAGFVAFRYVLALVAIVPLYLLLRRTYGRWAGVGGVALVMSNPVFISAWGTNYPDSAAISYLTGATCALVMPSEKRRHWWLLLAAVLMTMAVWAHGGSVPLIIAALVAYALVRALRERRHLLRDAGLLLGGAVSTTGILAWLSGLAIGQVNFITPTLQSERFLSRPYQESLWHSTNWRWLLYDPYLLIPPAVLIAFVLVFARRYRRVTDTQLFLGLCGLFEFLTAAFFQFVGKIQLVENHYFSSMLWAITIVLLSFVVAEIAKDLADWHPFANRLGAATPTTASRVARALLLAIPFLLVVGVALGYEADRHVPAIKLRPWGLGIAAIAILVVAIWRVFLGWDFDAGDGQARRGLARAAGAFLILVGLLGANLLLTVAPEYRIPAFPHVVADPTPTYPMSLGGSATLNVDVYQVITELPGFVGHPTYKGEQLLTWWPWYELGPMVSAIGMFHADFNSVHGSFPELTEMGVYTIRHRHPAEILLMSLKGRGFKKAVRQLRPYLPRVARAAVLKDGGYAIHVELVYLLKYLKGPYPAAIRAT